MRLDKYLKIARIIKRRTVAKEASDAGIVKINGKVAKAATQVAVGDELEIVLGKRKLLLNVTELKEHVKKEDAALMYEILSSEIVDE